MSTLTDSQLGIIESTFAALAPRIDEIVARFYERLFLAHPGVKPLFADTDAKKQRQHLVSALKFVVANLRKPDVLAEHLHELGRRHVGYGAEPGHYGAVAEVLIGTLADFAGKAWTPAAKKAWTNGLGAVAGLMLEGTKTAAPSPTPARPAKATKPTRRGALAVVAEPSEPGVSAVPVPCMAVDANGVVVSWNRAAEILTGRAASDVIGKRSWFGFGGSRRSTALDEALGAGKAVTARE
ncbi:MAG: PAS domain-containing protein, partial [Myxococcales bacterium]|nr:PAS domain-containing protein [Myxococcales bacterium]